MLEKPNNLYNADLAPIPPSERTWGIYNYASLWIAMSVCIPTYMLASGLIASGMTWKQALFTILLGNLIVLVPMVLNAHAGTKYGIPFPVYVRASFGVRGANVPALLRALVACGWFGIQCWIGGQAIHSMLSVLAPGIANNPSAIWICFFAFWLINMYVVWRGIEVIKALQVVSAPFMLAVGLLLLFWMSHKAGGLSHVLATASQFHVVPGKAAPDFWKLFVPSLTAIVGFWATVALNIPDFTRYSKSQKAQIVGQAIGLPTAMTLFSFIGIAVTAASAIVFGSAIWDPVVLLGKFDSPVIACIGLVALLIATLNTNVAANVVSPSNDFSNLSPRHISFRVGGLITGVLGVLFMPWKLAANPEKYINEWLVGYSGLLGPIAGIMIADYFVVRRKHLDTEALYIRGGPYEYSAGFNPKALIALATGIVVALVGLFVPELAWLYSYAWFVGFAVSAVLYILLMSGPDIQAHIPPTPILVNPPVDIAGA